MHRNVWGLIAIVVGIGAGLAYFWSRPATTVAIEPLACEDIQQGCKNADLTIRAMTTPKVMQSFEMRIDAAGAEKVVANFEMKDMQMGVNRYRFQPQADGSWQALVTLPLCAHGRNDWSMTVETIQAGHSRHYQLEFSAQP